MQRHDVRSRGKGGKAWTPTAYGGSHCQPGVRALAAAVAHLGGVGNLRKKDWGVEGRPGHGGHAGRREGCGLAGGRARDRVGMW